MNPGEQDEINYQPTPQAPVGTEVSVVEAPPQAPTPQPVQPLAADEAKSPDLQDSEAISWQASEFVDHQKSGSWLVIFVVASVIACALAYFVMDSIFSAIVIGIALAYFAVVAFQKPRTLTYSISGTSLRVGEKTFKYDDFRSFSLVRDGALWSIVLQPLKRFMPPLTIYFAQEDGERIFDALADHLPHEEHQFDSVDRLMRKIRF